MKSLSARAEFWLIAAGYVAVVAIAAILLLGRYLQEIAHPADAAAAGGMYAAGDAILYLFIACLFMIPTFFLLRVMARSEARFTAYSQLLLAFSLSAPLCLALLFFGLDRVPQMLGFLCLYRLVWSPLVLVGIIVSRLVARFPRPKRFTTYAVLVEGLTLAVAIALLFRRH